MENVIITGATSFIGIHLVNTLLKYDYSITAVVRPNSKNKSNLPKDNRIHVVELDMQEIQMLPDIVQCKSYDVFYHLAWDGVRAPHRDDRLVQFSNYEATVKAFKTANVLNCKIFIGSGSQAEYGRCLGKITEEYNTEPLTEYGKSKLLSYNTLNNLAEKLNIHFKWVRIFSAYGIHDNENTLIMASLKKMVQNEEIFLTECIQKWDFINVEDVANVLHMLVRYECEDGVYNVASGISKELKEYIYEMKRITRSNSKLIFGAVEYGQEGIVSFEPVVEKLVRNFNWECKVSFKEGVLKLLQYIDRMVTYEKS